MVYLLAGLLAQTCENLLEQGITPDVYYNGHLAYERDDVKEHNDALVDKYYRRHEKPVTKEKGAHSGAPEKEMPER